MDPKKQNDQVTVRGGLVNVPPSNVPTQPPRHQPDTPRIKKDVKTKPDHQVYAADSAATADSAASKPHRRRRRTPTEPETDPPA